MQEEGDFPPACLSPFQLVNKHRPQACSGLGTEYTADPLLYEVNVFLRETGQTKKEDFPKTTQGSCSSWTVGVTCPSLRSAHLAVQDPQPAQPRPFWSSKKSQVGPGLRAQFPFFLGACCSQGHEHSQMVSHWLLANAK